MQYNEFEHYANEWWNELGPFALLHKMNAIRLQYIYDNVNEYNSLQNKKAIDIGCGGGILTIPMARTGMIVHGLEPSQKSINVAIEKSKQAKVVISYYCNTLEEIFTLPLHKEQYDIVTCMEVIEHVDDYKVFLMQLCNLIAQNGYLFISTINRTILSYIQAIVAAERIFNIVPKNTHKWSKFLKPSEILNVTQACNMTFKSITGIKFDVCTQEWKKSIHDVSVNYILCLQKRI